jgi:FkbM family methyltransferase
VYKVHCNSKSILIDIGFNIGATSLFFAQYENVEHIYAFEPFKETYEQAVDNLKLNKNLQNKITAYNYGLSDKEEIKNVLYSKKRSGSMSVMSDFYHSELKVKDMHLSKVTLKAADKEISNIISKTTNQIILKMDCEGSEYAIIDLLNKSGVLKDIDCILLEWHFKGTDSILNTLKQNNFTYFSLYDLNENYGMIYAVKDK